MCLGWVGVAAAPLGVAALGVAKAIGVLALVSKGKCARNCIKMPTQKHKNYGHTLGTGQQQHHHTALSSALGPVISSTPAVCALQSWPGGRREAGASRRRPSVTKRRRLLLRTQRQKLNWQRTNKKKLVVVGGRGVPEGVLPATLNAFDIFTQRCPRLDCDCDCGVCLSAA